MRQTLGPVAFLYFGIFEKDSLHLFLCLIQLLPSLEMARASETGIWPELAKSYSLDPACLLTQLLPNHFGSIVKGTFIFPDNPSFFFEKYCFYFGALMLLLSIAGIVLAVRSKKYFWPALFFICSILALGTNTPIYNWLYQTVPALDLIRVPARFYFLASFALILLACKAMDSFKEKRFVLALILLVTTFDLAHSARSLIYPENISSYRKSSGIDTFIKPGYRMISDPDTVPSNKSMLYHNMNLNGYETLILENFVKYIGLQEKQVFGPTGLARTDLLSPLAKGLSFRYIVTRKQIPGLVLAGETQTGLKVYETKEYLPMIYFPRTISVFENTGHGAFDGINYLRKTSYSPDQETILDFIPPGYPRLNSGGSIVSLGYTPARYKAELKTLGDSSLVLSEIYYPGWKASLDGQPIKLQHADKSLRAVLLPRGEYLNNKALFIYYDPVTWVIGACATTAVLIVLLFMSFLYFIKPKLN